MSPITRGEVAALASAVFGTQAGATLRYKPGAPVAAARATSGRATFEQTVKALVREHFGSRAAAVHNVATILYRSMPGEANTARPWSATDKATLKAKLPKA